MSGTNIRVIAFFVSLLLTLQFATASADEAKKVFDSLFAAKIKSVTSTSDRADDIALAKEMFAIAKTSENQPELLALLCDQAHDLSLRHADGFGTGVEAQQLLADKVETKRAGAQDKLTTLLTRQMTTGKVDEREGAGESLIALLLSMGDEKFEKKQYPEAAGDYRRAVTVATQRKAPSLEEAKAKLEFAAARDRAVKSLARLQEKLLRDANDAATAEEIVKLYVVEFDDPAGAVPYAKRTGNPQVARMLESATSPKGQVAKEECLTIAEWYKQHADGSRSATKLLMLQRASDWAARFLELHTETDLVRTKATVFANSIKQEIKTLEPANPMPGGSTSASTTSSTWINLIKDFDPAKHVIDGTWTKTDKGLTVQYVPNSRSRVIAPVAVHGSYQFSISFVATEEGANEVAMLIPVGDKAGTLVLSKDAETKIRLSGPQVKFAKLRDTRITPSKAFTAECAIQLKEDDVEITVLIDGERLKPWRGKVSDMIVHEYWALRDPSWLAVGMYSTGLTITSFKLRVTSGTTKPADSNR